MFRMAWRNLWRNRTRTLISISAIALSYAVFLLWIGMADSMYEDMEIAAAEAAGGNVLIHADGFWLSQTNEKYLQNPAGILESARNTKNVEAVAPRVILDGLLSTSTASSPVRLSGVDPAVEKLFGNPAKYLVRGEFFLKNEESPIVIGAKTARTLNVDLGDRIVLTTTAPDGEMQRALFYLSGVLQGGISIDEGPAYTTLAAAQKAVRIGDGLTQIGLLTDASEQDEVKTLVAKSLPAQTEIMTWREAMPDLVGFIELDRSFDGLYRMIVFVVVVFAVMNTFLMIVMERIRELGLLAALGLNPSQLGRLLMIESFLMAVVAVGFGFVLALVGHSLLVAYGFDMSILFGDDMTMGGVTMIDTVIESKITVSRWVSATLSVVVLVMCGAIYPAYKASRLNPSQAMRFFL